MRKRFIFEFIVEDDGKIAINSEGDGMSCFEVLGALDWKRSDIMKQITGEVKPDKVTRTAIISEDSSEPEARMYKSDVDA